MGCSSKLIVRRIYVLKWLSLDDGRSVNMNEQLIIEMKRNRPRVAGGSNKARHD